MLISLVMCTRDRAGQLGRVLESAAAMDIPPGLEWEMVLVDNGSSDNTREVALSFADRLPIRYVCEPKAGLSNARNHGVAEARGKYICWTDDDVVIDRGWLAAYAAAFARHPEAAFFGGRVEPVLEGTPPDWFTENRELLGGLLAERDLGPEPIALTPHGNLMPYGANYAVLTSVQKQLPYDPELGVSPRHKRLGEETGVLIAMVRLGLTGFWVPDSRVRHMVPHARQTLDYVRIYKISEGETWAYTGALGDVYGQPQAGKGKHLFGAPVWLMRHSVKHRLQCALARLRGAPSRDWLTHWCWYAFYLGAARFWRERRRSGQELEA